MMRGTRALAILTSLVLAVGVLSVGTFAAESGATAPTTEAAQPAPENPCAEGHAYEVKSTVAPTCTEDGYSEEVCSRCGDTRRVPGEKALGHDFSGEGKVTVEPTTEKAGEMVFTCTHDGCNETQTQAIPKLEKKAEDTASAAPAASEQNQTKQDEKQNSEVQNANQTQNSTGTVNQPAAVEHTDQTAQAAQEIQNTNLSVAGIVVTEKKGTIQAGSSKIKFKREGEGAKEEITLTFDDSKLVVNGSSKKQPPEAVIAYTGTGTLNISIEGENTVTGKNSSYGVYAPDGTVKLTGKKGASLDIQAASENSNTIRAKEIVVDDSLEIAGPENNYVYEGSNGMGGTYQTIAVANNGRNMAVSKVTIQDPAAAQKQTDTEDEKEEETKDEEKTDETTDTVDGNGEKKDETSDENDQKDEAVTEDQEEKNTDVPAKNTPNTTKKTALGSSNTQTEGNGESSKSNDSDNNDVNDQDNKSDSNGNEDNQGGSTTTTTGGGTTTRTTTTTTTTEGGTTTGTTTGSGTTTGEGTQTGTGTGSGSGASTQTSTVGDQGTTTVADLLIDGVKISDEKGSVVAGSGKIEYEFTKDGENIKKVTVTLNNAELTSKADAAIYYKGNSELVIILKGENKLTGTDYAIYAPFAQLTIEGEKENSMTGTSENTVGSPAAIVSKKIIIKSPLEVTDPEEFRIAEIDTTVSGQNVTYQNIAKGKESGNAALTVKIEVPKYTVTYKLDGGEGKIDSPVEKYKGDDLVLPGKDEVEAPEGQEFDQWQIGTKKYDAGASVTVNEDITITAVWKAKEDKKEDVKPTPHTHSWNTPEYKWADDNSTVTAQRTCKTDSSHVETETVNTTKTTTATCDKAGKATYSAAFNNKDFEKQTKTVEEKALGHEWDMSADGIVGKMSQDGSQVTYTFKCLNCDETKTVVVPLTEENTVLPTENKAGSVKYETTLDGKKAATNLSVNPAGTKGYAFTVPQRRNAAVWVKNSKKSLDFTIKRGSFDTITYQEFQNGGSILVDNKKVDAKNYTVEKGSLKITLKPDYLNTLAAGTHTLHVNFGDGSVEEKFTVSATSATGNGTGTANRTANATTNRTANATTNRTATGSPSTGDTSNWALWIGLIAVSAAAICGIVFVRKRGKKDESADNS